MTIPRQKEISTRAIYLAPNAFSDEAICIGILYEDNNNSGFESIQSRQVFDKLHYLYGDELVDNLKFSLRLLRESISENNTLLSEMATPTDLLRFGTVSLATVENTANYISDLLRISSSLYNSYRLTKNRFQPKTQEDIEKEFKQKIVDIDPLAGRRIVESKKVRLRDKTKIDIPIFGERIIGAPVSISISRSGSSIGIGEAYIAKLNWAREALILREGIKRVPKIYVYKPETLEQSQRSRIDDGVYELEEIGKASDVEVFAEHDMSILATRVYSDEGLTLNS